VFDSGVDCRANHVIHLLLSVHLLHTPINLQMTKHFLTYSSFNAVALGIYLAVALTNFKHHNWKQQFYHLN
jgi:hypothetical protein